MRNKILIVDDIPSNIRILSDVLAQDYEVFIATNGGDALKLAALQGPDLILLDIMMPEMDGFEVIRRLKAAPATQDIPVLFLTAKTDTLDEEKGLLLGAVDYITKPINIPIILARLKNHLMLRTYQLDLEDLVAQRTEELEGTRDTLIKSFARLAEFRDPETGAHINRTQHYVKLLAESLSQEEEYQAVLTPYTIELLFKSAPLHDVGKVGIQDHILLKPGKLTEEEFEEIKNHTIYGSKVILAAHSELKGDSFLHFAYEVALTHHEKWDGSGYPHGLKGDKIPLSGRLMAIADVYDALISKRVYKAAMPHKKALQIIKESSGSHFDPALVEHFLQIHSSFQQVALQYTDEDT